LVRCRPIAGTSKSIESNEPGRFKRRELRGLDSYPEEEPPFTNTESLNEEQQCIIQTASDVATLVVADEPLTEEQKDRLLRSFEEACRNGYEKDLLKALVIAISDLQENRLDRQRTPSMRIGNPTVDLVNTLE
jgi:hypothetical protein